MCLRIVYPFQSSTAEILNSSSHTFTRTVARHFFFFFRGCTVHLDIIKLLFYYILPEDGCYTETCRSNFNFNVNFNVLLSKYI